MAKQLASKWRESASLIILAKDKLVPTKGFDYEVLLFNRHAKATFMPNSSVFPGGVRESVDESHLWLEHFKKFGLQTDRLKELLSVSGPRPSIFSNYGDGCLEKEISLRITAIRETFEEVGVFICRDSHSLNEGTNGYGQCREDFDRAHWQSVVHKDPAQFLTLCRELDVVPDLWSLHEWSAWLTPSHFKRRFETAFYLVALPSKPQLVLEKNEVKDFAWKTPMEYLQAYANKELWLPPPQLYELSRLINLTDLEEVKEFARQRAIKHGMTLILPVQYKCTDGEVSVYPGDDAYPDDANDIKELKKINCSMKEFRADIKKLHRAEFRTPHNAELHKNIPPVDGHLSVNQIRL